MEYSNTILHTNVQSTNGKCFNAAAKLIRKKNSVYLCAFITLTKLLINSSLVIYLLFFTQAFFKTKFCIPKQLLCSACVVCMPYAECVQVFHYYQCRDEHMLFYAVEGLSISELVLNKPLI